MNIIIDFILFSLIETFIVYLFVYKVFKCKKVKTIYLILMALINSILSQLLPNILYQVIIIIWISIFLYFYDKNKIYTYYLKMMFKIFIYFFIIETVYGMSLQVLFNFNGLSNSLEIKDKLKLFCLMIPLRIIEFIGIKIMEVTRMKLVLGGVVRR